MPGGTVPRLVILPDVHDAVPHQHPTTIVILQAATHPRIGSWMSGGTYTLVIEVPTQISISVGSLGTTWFRPGGYAYTGSAHGPGGFARIDRHREIASGSRDTRHWHIDYLLGQDGVRIQSVVRTPGAAIECQVAAAISGETIPEFGATGCGCPSHLTHMPDLARLKTSVQTAHTTSD